MLSIPVVPFALMGVFALALCIFAVVVIRWTLRREKLIQENGIETDAIVIKDETYRSNGRTRHKTHVLFTGIDGKTHLCVLGYAGGMPVGRKLRVKYLPGEYDYVSFVSQELP